MENSRRLVCVSTQAIRWGDMDALGHVNNTVYFRYMEQARVEWLDALGVDLHAARDEGVVVVNASCTFLVPLTYPGNVEVRMFFDKPGRSSLQTHYELRKSGEETLYAEGAAKMVWVDMETGKSAPWPEWMLKSLVD